MTSSADVHTHRAKHQRVANDADQAEQRAILRGYQTFESGISDDRISGAIQDIEDLSLPGTEGTQFQRQDLSTEDGAGKVYAEVERRKAIMMDAYPFDVSTKGIAYRPSKSGFYEFCLAAARSPTITTGKYVEFPRQFERASAILVQLFLGNSAHSLHLGKPRDHDVGKTFIEGMKTLAARSGEFYWKPDDALPVLPTTSGDEGVDFIAWRRLDHARPGSLFVLCQCACGDDWLTKWEELNFERYRKWFGPMTLVSPMKAFATPFHAVDGNLNEASRIAGLVFDRARLAILAEEHTEKPEWAPWKERLDPVSKLVFSVP